jgi:hypothetical protein
MGWRTYVDALVRHGKPYFYLQRIDDHLAGPHPVLAGADGRLGIYPSEAEARHAAETLNEPIEAQAPYIDDMDAVHAWAADARSEAIDYGVLMVAWHTLVDFGVLEPMPIERDASAPEYALSEVSDKIHIGFDVATNPGSTFATPSWSPAEVSILANTLLRGLGGLDDLLQAGSITSR